MRPVGAHADGADDPLTLVTTLYRQELKSSDQSWSGPAVRHRYLSTSLAGLWDRADAHRPKDDELGPVDFDIAADTNGLTLTGFTPVVKRRDAQTATVGVRLRYQKPYTRSDPAFVIYDLVRDKAGWRIDEIHTGRWSLRQILALYLKPS